MVESVEQFGTELNVYSFSDLRVLEDTEVKLIQRRTTFTVACHVPERISKTPGGAWSGEDVAYLVLRYCYEVAGPVQFVQRVEPGRVRREYTSKAKEDGSEVEVMVGRCTKHVKEL